MTRIAGLFLIAAMAAAPLPAAAEPTAEIADFGQAEDGTVKLVTLRNDNGMVVRISSRGGTTPTQRPESGT